MRKLRINNNDRLITIENTNQLGDYTSEFGIDMIFSGETENNINKPQDYEIIDFNYFKSELAYNIFFFKPLSDRVDEVINSVTSNSYQIYRNLLFDQLEGLQVPQITGAQLNYNPIDFILNSESVVRNFPLTLNTVLPTFDGVPSFYSTFAYPYYSVANSWYNKQLKYSADQYLYNSFLIFEFYDTTEFVNRNLVMTQVVYNNPRYNNSLQLSNTPWTTYDLLTPTILIDNTKDTYTINWVKDNLTEFYVQVYFWDAANGNKIPLIPTSDKTTEKQWVQNQETFNYDNLYLKYTFDTVSSTYQINEYNPKTGFWDIETNDFDFYQLIFDEYWSQHKPEIIFPKVTFGTIADPITANIIDFKLTKDDIDIRALKNIKNVLNETQLGVETDLGITNTGTVDLILDNIRIDLLDPSNNSSGINNIRTNSLNNIVGSSDSRIVTRSGSTNTVGSYRTISTNTYTRIPGVQSSIFAVDLNSFIPNQNTYTDQIKFTDYSNSNVFPIDINKANTQNYKDRFGEVLRVLYKANKNKVVKPNETVNFDIIQTVGTEYYRTFFPVPLFDLHIYRPQLWAQLTNFVVPTPTVLELFLQPINVLNNYPDLYDLKNNTNHRTNVTIFLPYRIYITMRDVNNPNNTITNELTWGYFANIKINDN